MCGTTPPFPHKLSRQTQRQLGSDLAYRLLHGKPCELCLMVKGSEPKEII